MERRRLPQLYALLVVELHGRQSFHGGPFQVQRPPSIVATTFAFAISSVSYGSLSSTTRSARYPGTSLPRRCSSPASHAGLTVVACNASSSVSACSGCQARDTAATTPAHGSSSSIGASEPFASSAPVSQSDRYA